MVLRPGIDGVGGGPYDPSVARLDDRLPENAPGDFYVDASCIDCGTCREVARETFAIEGSATEQSYVRRQPDSEEARLRAGMALVACPTSSIGDASKSSLAAAVASFPEPIVPELGVYFCGYAAESSFGARSYLVKRDGGNVLVDSPRAAKPLGDRIEALGGARWMFLTHRDDVADHAHWAARLSCERILHARDVTSGTRAVERKLDGEEPIRLADDLVAIPVPGHTRGSVALLYADEVLFTGDHLWATEDGTRLHASRSVCWYSWPEQTRSMERLLDYRFTIVLPGHGRRFRASSARAMRDELERLIAR